MKKKDIYENNEKNEVPKEWKEGNSKRMKKKYQNNENYDNRNECKEKVKNGKKMTK